ncbi:MAG: steroid-24-oyl-CoA synthetase [Pseudonocardiales bacterium]|jgi:hypothetical protein|nr:steroid-24-oyl-CoA synthetase [Pseudonocardiales bacterium]
MRLHRRGPHTLRELFAGTAAVAGRTFLVHEQERWTYGERVDLLAGRDLPPVLRVRGHRAAPAGARDWADVVTGLDPDPTHAGSTLPDVDVLPDDDDATIVYTSGTTGRPKGLVSTEVAMRPPRPVDAERASRYREIGAWRDSRSSESAPAQLAGAVAGR